MYWRVQKVGPEQLVKLYGVHLLLVVSLIGNGFLWLSRPAKTMPAEVKQDVEAFSRRLTGHLLDTSYISCENNMNALREELDPPLAANLTNQGILPKNQQDMKALVLDMQERKQICAVRIDQVNVSEPTAQGLIPVRVSGVCAIHSAAETAERPFVFQYLIGQRAGTTQLLLSQYQDLTPQ
jgi:hypothetical protein